MKAAKSVRRSIVSKIKMKGGKLPEITTDLVKEIVLKQVPPGQRYVQRSKLPKSFPYRSSTMRQFDYKGIGPKNPIKIGNKVYYRLNPELIEWLVDRIKIGE